MTTKCKGITKSGKQCSRNVSKKMYCASHSKPPCTQACTETPTVAPKSQEKSTEIFGMSCEVALCEIFGIEHRIAPSRICRERVEQCKKVFQKSLGDHPKIALKQHIGGKDKVDFMTHQDETVSLKSNYNGSTKICPQIIGQTTKKKFCSFFGFEILSNDEIKEAIMNHIKTMILPYLKNLFCCKYLIWITLDKKNQYGCHLFQKEEMLEKFGNLDPRGFTWTRNLEKWNESNTLKWNNIPLAEFQIHSHRNSIKMRFDAKFFMKDLPKFTPKQIEQEQEDIIVYDKL
jgi:hypothetical protein